MAAQPRDVQLIRLPSINIIFPVIRVHFFTPVFEHIPGVLTNLCGFRSADAELPGHNRHPESLEPGFSSHQRKCSDFLLFKIARPRVERLFGAVDLALFSVLYPVTYE